MQNANAKGYVENVYKRPVGELKLADIVGRGLIEIKDEWQYSGVVGGVHIAAQVTVTGLGPHGSIAVDIASGIVSPFVLAPPSGVRPAYTQTPRSWLQYSAVNITGPKALQDTFMSMHNIPARVQAPKRTWPLFECYRRTYYIGTLGDLRQDTFDLRTGGNPAILQNVKAYAVVRKISKLGKRWSKRKEADRDEAMEGAAK